MLSLLNVVRHLVDFIVVTELLLLFTMWTSSVSNWGEDGH